MNRLSQRMSLLLVVMLCCCLVHAQKNTERTASLSGLLWGGDRAAIALHLESVEPSPVRFYDGYESIANKDGNFSFTAIPPGRYKLTAVAEGMSVTLPTEMFSGIVTLRAGEVRKNVSVFLAKKGSICGYVTNEISVTDSWTNRTIELAPAPLKASLVYYRYNPEFGGLEAETKTSSDEKGYFNITNLEPGTYYLKATGPWDVWYPGTNFFGDAKPIVVGTKASANCNTYLLVENTSFGNVRKLHVDLTGISQPENYKVSLKPRNAEGVDYPPYSEAIYPSYGTGVTANSGFPAFTSVRKPEDALALDYFVRSGSYDLMLLDTQRAGDKASNHAPAQKVIFNSVPVTIAADKDSTIQLSPLPKATLEGELHLNKVSRDEFCPHCSQILISILREGNGEFQSEPLSNENHFAFQNVTPGTYQIFVTTTQPDRVFLDSILVDGVAGNGHTFTIPEAKPVSMVVTLSGDITQAPGHASPDVRYAQHWEPEAYRPKATIAGRIEGGDKAPYTVRLLPLRSNSNVPDLLPVQAEGDGSFHFENVTPGIYFLRAYGKDLARFDYGGVGQEKRGMPLVIESGAKLKELTLTAPQITTSSVCGRILSPNTLQQHDTKIYFLPFLKGVPNTDFYYQPLSFAPVDQDGYFRMDGLTAGDYLLRIGATYISADGKIYEANPLHLSGGKNVGCAPEQPLALRLPADNQNIYEISGSVVGYLPDRYGNHFVAALKQIYDSGVTKNIFTSDSLDENQGFHFRNLFPGHYQLSIYGRTVPKRSSGNGPLNYDGPQVILSSGGGASMYPGIPGGLWGGSNFSYGLLVATQMVAITDQDISHLKLTPLTLPSVTGKIHVPADWSKLSKLSLSLVSRTGSYPQTIQIADDGSFSIPAIEAGSYELRIDNWHSNAVLYTSHPSSPQSFFYIKHLLVNGKPFDPFAFPLEAVPSVALDMELGNGSGALTVQVLADPATPNIPPSEECEYTSRRLAIALLPDPRLNAEPGGPDVYPPPQMLPISCVASVAATPYSLYPGSYHVIAADSLSTLLANRQQYGVAAWNSKTDEQSLLRELSAAGKPLKVESGKVYNLEIVDQTLEVARIAARVGALDEPENLGPQMTPLVNSCCRR